MQLVLPVSLASAQGDPRGGCKVCKAIVDISCPADAPAHEFRMYLNPITESAPIGVTKCLKTEKENASRT